MPVYTLYDNGGASDAYSNSQGHTLSIKPCTGSGKSVRLTLNSNFILGAGDTFAVYTGTAVNSTPSGSSIVSVPAAGSLTTPKVYTSCASDGSLTVQFGSDSATNAAGYSFNVECVDYIPPTIITSQPSASTATYCVGTAATALSVVVSPSISSPTYQWYTNAANSNSGGSVIAGATLTSYTPPTAVGNLGTTYYYCIVTDAVCSRTDTSTVSGGITVNNGPTTITVSTSGTYCNSTTLTAANGGSGTIYWQNNTSGGTSTATPSTSQLVSASGTYYFRAYNGSCWGIEGSATVTINNVPSAPVASAGTGVTSSQITANWAASAGATGYYLDVATDSGFTSMVSGYSNLSVLNVLTYNVTGLASGTTYYYRVRAANSCGSGTSSGTIITTTLTNNDCSGATSLTVNPNTTCSTSTTGDSSGATQSQLGCSGNADDDVWFKFVATSTTHIVTATPITLNDIVFQVFSGNCAGLVSTICVDSTSGSTAETTTLTGLTVGNIYYVRVYSNGNSINAGTFTICVTTPAQPSNNQCANATSLPCATLNLAGTTVLTNSYSHGTGCLMSNYGVWYTFTGDGNSSTISVTTTTNDIELSISTGSCGSLTNIACQDVALSNGTETYTFTTAIGVNYYIYIANWYSAGTGTDTGTFTISRTCVVPYNPCASIPNIAACGSATNVTIASGTGGYSSSACGWTTPGVEQIYTFTPASTGNFTITQSSSFTYIDYQFKPFSSGCGSTGWTCIDAMSGADISPSFTLTAGTQYYILLDPETTTGGIVNFTINCPSAPLSNDDPCSAISLPVNTSCSYSTYTNSGAAATGGVTAPGCASYVGSDVWFSAVVPATGVLTVDLQSGVITDSGMAFYSGTCGSLTLLECDDDDSTNGLMSNISMSGLTAGQTIYIRVWEYGNDNNGTFGICATTPSCPSPSDLYANILSATSATINWANTTPPASNGYQYYITTTNTPPTSGSTPTGSTTAGVNGVTLTGLTPGQVYYFWVRAYCGGTDYSTWFGPTNYTPCAVGSGTGTTTLSCPSVVSGGQGLSGADPAALLCSASTCTNLEATYLQLNQATDYTVASIPYAPPYQYTCLQNPVSVNVDDKWSPTINLPFDFCFYGNNYNKCLIGSNGVITFDTVNNIPGGYSTWSFNTDLPSTSLFKNTIFGVYHDIDPGIGGKVAWELITLNTGCRALVASWDNIPMFSSTCNSSFYTGMIVLYENTNVIDVFIKEKNVCATWNNGNAIVGIQNSTGTAAVVAANRNGLSTNWTVTNEAWRFTPSGPSLTSIKWYEGTGTTGTVVGTTDIVNVCPSVTTVYTAEVTYALCSGTNLKYTDNVLVTVTGTKIWDGSTNTNWNVDDNWTPSGVPTSANCIVIPDVANDPIISAAPDAVGYNLLIYPNAQLIINSNQNLTITDKITVESDGIFSINNSASLIQINNVLNSGNITYDRISPTIRTLDYVYWSSPVANFNVSNIVLPYTFGLIYKWNTTLLNANTSQGNWQNASGNIMVAAKGYIARAPGTSPFNNTTFNPLSGSFTGVPNNGNITIPIERGTDQNTAFHTTTNLIEITNLSDNWNLLGNPYPSSIRGSQFLFDNRTKIEGNIRLWTHGTLPSTIEPSPFYNSFVSNYTPGDYLTYNFTGTSCCPTAGSDLFIGAAQGFFVQMIDGPAVAAAANVTVGFNNNLRSATYSNSTFYKMQNSTTSTSSDITDIERNRIWLDLVNPNNQTDRTLFGYIENATMERDSFYDCITQNTGGTLIYSLADDTKFSIQGRALPFDVNDEVPIGVNIPTQGNYTIAIAAVDGLFTTQNIYLKDNLFNSTYDIKISPYQFTSAAGAINDRFKIVYINAALGNPDYSSENNIKVMVNSEVAVSSSNLIMESIVVYNVLGQKLATYNNLNSNYVTLSNLRKNNTTLLLKIKLQTGETVTRKIIY